MKLLVAGALALVSASSALASPVISTLEGATDIPQWQYLSTDNEWFSRYSSSITTADLQSFKNAPGNANGLNLYATSDTVKITYLGTGATRNSNLFLSYAGSGTFDTASFWNPIYASGGTNNLSTYNPVNSSNQLFETRGGCTYQQAKNGNTCLITQLGMSREVTGLFAGENLVFGLQTLPLVYDGINLPNVNYFFTGDASNNKDSKGWNDGTYHAKLISKQVGTNAYLVGFEDTWLGTGSTSDRDYNDMVFLFEGITVTQVPEPSSALLAVAALGALAGLRARRRAAK